MSIHKLTAGSGYDYLTRQVAALDATEKGHVGLSSYYSERGESPGVWVGAGMTGIDGLAAGDVVTAEQMRALFGHGLHPLAAERQQHVATPGSDGSPADSADRLGAPFKVYAGDVGAFRVEVAKRLAAVNATAGLPGDWSIPAAERAAVRTEVAREFFAAEFGREPADARELAATIAKHSRPKTSAVAGYDLTFSPVKSVSTLWAVADLSTAAAIEGAHQAAVRDALTFLESHALFTRTGTNGVRQVDVRGLVATAFTHRDSRAGDPDLHTHVAVANKVQTLDGRWLAIDGRVLFKATVAASETYNTALERHLTSRLGVRFEPRANPDPRLRPVREIVGVDPRLNGRWSARRADIDTRRGQLAVDFQRDHGRPPTPVEALRLAQQATLETRHAKHVPRTLTEQRATWHADAIHELGDARALRAMVRQVLAKPPPVATSGDENWFARAAVSVVEALEERRSTWQVWHVRAEAHRRVRSAEVPGDRVEALVDRLVAEVLQRRSVSLARPDDGITEPDELRRADGSSVYTVAGADLFTSAPILAAERRLVATAGHTGGFAIQQSAVDAALTEAAADGLTLNAGQAALVREMATSGARLQLAIAPAGAGKTTAVRALTMAWTRGGGTVVGLAPSAAAAEQLRDQVNLGSRHATVATDTLAKLTWSVQHGDLPPWAAGIGPSTLVVIDEAGMADTLSLDAAVQFVVDRGGSVRLIGDDQQLAAIGAGGVLRDIQASHGAVHLTELLRFTDPAEGAASLALRSGRTEALGFYLDNHRVHVGDLATITEDLFDAWRDDRSRGLDSIMLAPTRDLVSELNQRAQTHRLASAQTITATTGDFVDRPATTLADGNQASVGDLVITRTNDRRLRVSPTDWVKNGDRWTVLSLHPDGLQVQHLRNGRTVRLPSAYVQTAVELGYATTVHTAQGVSADTMHGLSAGNESRQQLYTMLTRGRAGNHVYLQVVGDGDPHTAITPDTISPPTPTDLLEQILARDDAPRSATTLQREQHDPAGRLGEATSRYVDALYVAAEHTAGPAALAALDTAADQLLPDLTAEPAWPALRAHLLLLAADGHDPTAVLAAAAAQAELGTAKDRAAVLDWRLDSTGLRSTGPGPLPWLPGTPDQLRNNPRWGEYLTMRAQLVTDLADDVRHQAHTATEPPEWARRGRAPVPPQVVEDVLVWRAAMHVADDDRRPTGPPQLAKASRTWQQQLDQAINHHQAPAWQEWGRLLTQTASQVAGDTFAPVLAERLTVISRAGLPAHQLLHTAAAQGTLPDDHAAAALWWRISRHLTPPVVNDTADQGRTPSPWTPHLAEQLGAERSQAVQASRWWPALVTVLDHAHQRGWQLIDLIDPKSFRGSGVDNAVDDLCQAWVWRISLLMDPAPVDDDYEPFLDSPPADMRSAIPAGNSDNGVYIPESTLTEDTTVVVNDGPGEATDDRRWVEADLAVAAMIRDAASPPEQTDADVARMMARDVEWHKSPVSRERLLTVNQMAWAYFRNQYPNSWGPDYLTERFGRPLPEEFQPGHAPAGWTNLVSHLRHLGVTDQEMTIAGVATLARTGRLIDRFRDRVVFPIVTAGDIVGFVARRHPDLDDNTAGPKYLNTPETPLFHKGAQLFTAHERHLAAGVPVIVEGPMDAIAVTIATQGRWFGVAPLGTSLTDEQAAQLGLLGTHPVVATDADLAGRVAAERAFWLLAPHRLDPTYARLPDDTDPADLLRVHGAHALTAALENARPLGETLIQERLAHLPSSAARNGAIQIIAARPASQWTAGCESLSARLQLPVSTIRAELRNHVNEWNADPQAAARGRLSDIHQVRERLAISAPPHLPVSSERALRLDSPHAGDTNATAAASVSVGSHQARLRDEAVTDQLSPRTWCTS